MSKYSRISTENSLAASRQYACDRWKLKCGDVYKNRHPKPDEPFTPDEWSSTGLITDHAPHIPYSERQVYLRYLRTQDAWEYLVEGGEPGEIDYGGKESHVCAPYADIQYMIDEYVMHRLHRLTCDAITEIADEIAWDHLAEHRDLSCIQQAIIDLDADQAEALIETSQRSWAPLTAALIAPALPEGVTLENGARVAL